MNGKTRIYLTLAMLGAFGAAMIAFQPYTADWPGSGYTGPARSYLRAALRQDSAKLVRLSASAGPVRWALEAAREHPAELALWSRRAQAWTGERRGDTAEVFVYPDYSDGDACAEAPIVLRFVGEGRDARVVQAGGSCLER